MTKTTVAIVGLNGSLGQSTLKALADPRFRDHYNFPVRALTRDPSKFRDTEIVKYFSSSFDNFDRLVESLKGVDTLIDLTAPFIDSKPLVDAAHKAGVKLFFPSEFGIDHKENRFNQVFQRKIDVNAYARSKGIKTVLFITGFFLDWVIDSPEIVAGINKEKKTFTKVGSGERPITVTAVEDIASALASVAYRDPASLPDDIRVHGDSITANDAVALYEKVAGVNLTVVNVSEEQVIKNAENALKDLGTGFGPIAVILTTVPTLMLEVLTSYTQMTMNW